MEEAVVFLRDWHQTSHLHAGRCHCAVGSYTPTCRAFQQSEEDHPQGYLKGPGTWEALTVAVASTLPAVHILITSASGSTAFQESAGPSPLQSGARLLLFLSSTLAIFRPGDCLFPARVQSSRQTQVLIDGCRWLQGMT